VTHTGLGRQVDDISKTALAKQICDCCAIRKIDPFKPKSTHTFEHTETILLELETVVAIQVVDPDHRVTFGEQASSNMEADEPGHTGY
jgi:hypothetical protein